MITHLKPNDKHCFRMKTAVKLFFPCILFFFAVIACNDGGSDKNNPYDKPHRPSSPVVVSGIGPTEGGLGTSVIVTGDNFGNDPEKIILYFNEKKALILKVQDNAIYAMVPRQPGEFSTIKVAVEGKEGVLDGQQFQYFVSETVTTVAGVQGTSGRTPSDGPAKEAVFNRVCKIGVDDEGTVLISDDAGGRIRMYSPKDDRVVTLRTSQQPWSMQFNPDHTVAYIAERGSGQRPILFYGFSKANSYMEADIYYDQLDVNSKYIFGSDAPIALATDDTYVYVMSAYGRRFVRVHQVNRTVELIGESLPLGNYMYISYNKYDGYIYLCMYGSGLVYRFDPHYTPPGRTTPWITFAEWELVAGNGLSQSISYEGKGAEAQLGINLMGFAFDEDYVYLADATSNCIWRIDRLFNCTVYSGSPAGVARVAGYKDGAPKDALYDRPYDIAFSKDGVYLYIADTYNSLIRRIAIE